jgi:tetratricopeptide (TPR) repeat protein
MQTLRNIAFTLALLVASTASTASTASMASMATTVSLSAQIRGEGRITGKIVDEQGQPIADAAISATKKDPQGQAPVQAKSNAKGEWTLNQLAAGEWTVEFSKEGFQSQRGTVTLDEASNSPRVDVKLAKTAPDPNAEIQAELKRADTLLRGNQFADARKIYEDLLAKFPAIHQLHRFIAAAYAGEKNYPKAVEHLRLVLEKEPANIDVKVLLAELLMEQGNKAEGVALLQSIDLTQVKDPLPFINGAINLINDGKPEDAIALLTKLNELFPKQNEIYYYRARAYLAAKKMPEAKADMEKFVAAAPPDARELPDARKILEQLKTIK